MSGRLELVEEGSASDKQRIYMITLPHPRQEFASTGERLIPPGSLSKPEVLERILDAFSQPIYTDARSLMSGYFVKPLMGGVFREAHAPTPDGVETHDHLPFVAEASYRFLPVKRALLVRHGLASHWSPAKAGYHGFIRYLVMPSPPKKPLAALDPEPLLWHAEGVHPPLQDCVHPPITAAAWSAKRFKLEIKAAERGKADPKLNECDVWALVVRCGARNTADDHTAHLRLAQYAKAHCGQSVVQGLFRMRHKLPSMIDDIWQWEEIDDILAVKSRTRCEGLAHAAAQPCVCEGQWLTHVVSNLIANGIDISELCNDIHHALVHGRGETTPIVVLAGARGGEGKSMFLKPLHNVYPSEGMVFARPATGGFPLIELPHAKVAFLDEYRWDPDILPFAIQCLWFDGSPVPVAQPQNQQGMIGHKLYKGSAPIFVTCKLPDLERLESYAEINPETGDPWDADASMLLRRLKVYKFKQRTQKPKDKLKFCGHCFANLLINQARARGA